MWRPRDGLRAGPGVKRRNDSARSTAGDQNGSDTRRNRGRSLSAWYAGGSGRYFEVPNGYPHDVAPALTVPSGGGKNQGALGIPIRRPAKSHTYRSIWCRATRCDRWSRLCSMDHRRGTERDCALRSFIQGGEIISAAQGAPSANLNTATLIERHTLPTAKTVSMAGLIRRLA